VFVAAATLAGACSGESSDSEAIASDATVAGTTQTIEATAPPDPTAPPTSAGNGADAYVDPRGDLFTEFQSGFDRSHPFQPLDSFCVPHDEAADRQVTEPGIEADAIEVHHIRQELENLIDIGFGVDIGDPTHMFDTFIGVINDECGGIRGRTVQIGHTSYDPLSPDIDQARIGACVSATEDQNAAFVMSSTGLQGTATLCVAEEHDTAMITTLGVEDAFMERGGGNLVTLDFTLNDSLRHMVERVAATGALDGRTIGVVGGDTPGLPESTQAGLVDTLVAAGHEVAVHDTIGCSGGTSCTIGVQESVGNMKQAAVDVVFPTLNVLSLPGYIAEMVTQGFQPGDVQFYNSAFNAHSADLVASKVKAFGGEAAGALYDGAVIVDFAPTNNQFLDGWPLPAFTELCNETYAANGGERFDFWDPDGATKLGMLTVVCSEVRVMARAIYDTGENPTRDAIREAIAALGPIDGNSSLPMSLGPGKYAAADVAQTSTWTSPCQIDGAAYDENETCFVPDDNWEAVAG
jgi:hypothetical protein